MGDNCCCCFSIALVIIVYYILSFFYRRLQVNVKGKAVVISGCDTGFGESLAKELDKLGMRVFAGCLTKEGANSLGAQLSSRSCVIPLDVTSDQSVAEALAKVNDRLESGGLYALVNNAGIAAGLLFDFNTISTFSRVMDVNYLGVVRLTKAFTPLLKKRGGRVINMSSVAGKIPAMGVYSASKHALECFSDNLRMEMEPFSIKVVIIEPGFTKTPILEKGNVEVVRSFNEAPEEIRKEYGEKWFKRQVETFKWSDTFAMDPKFVVDAYIEAIIRRFPYRRYAVGLINKILCQFPLLPSFLQDIVMKMLFNPPENVPSITSD